MTRDEFISTLVDILDLPKNDFSLERELSSIKAWDSVGILDVITLMQEIGAKVRVDHLRECQTITDMLKLVENQLD